MRVLTLDAAGDGCSAGLVVDGVVVAVRHGAGGRGQAAALPILARDVLAGDLSCIAVTVGPGSFTGIRAALALAHGIGLSAGVPVVGVTAGAALEAAAPVPAGWSFWTAVRARSGHVFLERAGAVRMHRLDALPAPPGPALVAGNAAEAVLERWPTARPAGLSEPEPGAIARAALLRPLPAEPLYVEPPRTTGAPDGT